MSTTFFNKRYTIKIHFLDYLFGLVLHGDHSYEDLIALYLKAAINITDGATAVFAATFAAVAATSTAIAATSTAVATSTLGKRLVLLKEVF